MVEVIGGLIGLMKLWLDYDVKKREAEKDGKSAPEKPKEAEEGKQVAETIAAVVTEHGDAKDQRALASIQDEPDNDLLVKDFEQKLVALAKKHPAVAQQLQAMAGQVNVETSGGVVGTVNVSGQGKVGQAIGVVGSRSTITYQGEKDTD